MKKNVLMFLAVMALFSVNLHAEDSQLVGDKYKLLQGDRVAISVWGEDTLNIKDIIVLPDGSISFPLAGNINVVGMTTKDVESQIAEKLKDYLPAPKVTVVVTGVEGNKAYVVGKVLKPGPLLLSSPMTVLQALSLAGGFDRFADTDKIKLVRNKIDGQTVFEIDYDYLVKGEKLEMNIMLKPGDTIVVP